MTVPAEYIALARKMADEAGQVARRHFRTKVPVETKPDATPVSLADREIERALRRMIEESGFDHAVIGEEEGGDPLAAASGWAWVIDPIDGTRAFLAGAPTFGTLIALCNDGVPLLGILEQPIARERWLGITGQAATLNGMPLRSRACGLLSEATFSTTSAFLFREADLENIRRLADAARSTIYGKDCLAYGLLAGGWIDLVVESGLKAHDILALVPILEGAGATLTRWDGMPLTLSTCHPSVDVIACGDARLLPLIQTVLRG